MPPPGARDLSAAGIPAGGLGIDPAPSAAIPQATSSTRGKHFRSIVTGVVFLGVTWTVAIVALIAAALQLGIGAGLGAAAVIVLLGLACAFAIASSRAADDFFDAYAAGRNLTRIGDRASLPPVTPLLRKGDRRYTEEMFNGTLPGGLTGSLALYTYEDKSRDSDGNEETTYYKFTVAVSQLPETAPYLSELALQRRFGFRFLDSAEDAFRSRQRVELESEEADKRFEIFIGRNDDLTRARQVFSPTFIVWLAEEAHEGIAFELVGGALVVNVKGHRKTAAELDSFCNEAAVVARRLLEEAAE